MKEKLRAKRNEPYPSYIFPTWKLCKHRNNKKIRKTKFHQLDSFSFYKKVNWNNRNLV